MVRQPGIADTTDRHFEFITDRTDRGRVTKQEPTIDAEFHLVVDGVDFPGVTEGPRPNR